MIAMLTLLLVAFVQQAEISPATQSVIAQRAALPGAEWIARLDKLADAGDASAAELLGELYQRGAPELARDEARACGYFERSAKTRGDGAQNLANCYYYGRGRSHDAVRARTLYATASQRGWPSAGCALGNMLIKGDGGAVDTKRGLELCQAGAEAGNADAQTDYGGYLLTGDITPRDPVAARKWLFAAAQQRQANAAFLLGQIYWNGDGVDTDRLVAARWWRVAHDNGRRDAALLLGREAASRVVVSETKAIDGAAVAEARNWFEIAAKADPTEEGRASAVKMLAALDEVDPPKR